MIRLAIDARQYRFPGDAPSPTSETRRETHLRLPVQAPSPGSVSCANDSTKLFAADRSALPS